MKYFYLVFVILIVIAIIFLIFKIFPLLNAKPTISVDYIAEYNKATKPNNYNLAENAAPYYEKAFEALEEAPDLINELKERKISDLDDMEVEVLSSWLESNAQAIEYLRQATQKKYYWVERYESDEVFFNIDIPELSKIRESVFCLCLCAKFSAHQGNIETAMECLTDALQIGKHLMGPKTLIEQLVGLAVYERSFQTLITIISEHTLEQEILTKYQSVFESELNEMKSLDFGTGERIFALAAIQNAFTDDGDGNGKLIPRQLYKARKDAVNLKDGTSKAISYPKAILICLNHPDRKQATQLSNALNENIKIIIKQTPWQLRQRNTNYLNEIENITKGNYLINDSAWAFSMLCKVSRRPKTTEQALITIIALIRYKNDFGNYPTSLQELISHKYINELPMDPYSDGPLVYNKVDENFLLYSVGKDFVDNGGVPSDSGLADDGDNQVFWPVQYSPYSQVGK